MRSNPVRFSALVAAVILLVSGALPAEDAATTLSSANPLRGKLALTGKGCTTCHSVWGVGGRLGPDLATAGADQSFQQLASMFWNHTPRMVELLKQKGFSWPVLTEQEMADILSFIYFLKLLDKPGDPSIGKSLFREKRCISCHSVDGDSLPLGKFGSFVSPVALAQAMWNAGLEMHKAQRNLGIAMPLFQGHEMADLQAYLRTARSKAGTETAYLPLPDLSRGGRLFRSKGCASCHGITGGASRAPDLSREPLRKSMSEICGILWNHSFAMQANMASRGITLPRLENNELADILSYIYFLHFSRDQGDAGRGEKVFNGKGCVNCHGGGGAKKAPVLAQSGERYDMLRLATSMWNHAPIMHESMENELMKWIKLDPDDMQDLSKFLRRSHK